MPLALMWFLIALVAVASLLCNSAAWLWMAAKWCRIPNVSYLRALATVLLIGVVNLCFRLVPFDYETKTTAAAALLLLNAIVATICVRQVLRTTTRRALAAGLIAMVISGIAAIVVLIPLRLFVMESFVISSGSMAPALIGNHFYVTCERCGRKFAVSAVARYEKQQRERGQGDLVAGLFVRDRGDRQQVCRCPNCRNERSLADELPTAAGDKILVDKIGFSRRWDLVVFRYPDDVSVRYVKRLVGLPGEKVEIIAGDVFINDRLEAKPFGIAHDLWIPVNDTRFRPGELTAADPQWKPDQPRSHWKWDHVAWTFSGADANPQELVFSGPTADESSYAERWSDERLPSGVRPLDSGDIQVACTLTRFAGDGPLGFRWAFRGGTATASVMGNGEIELRADEGIQQARLRQPLERVKEIAFAVRDGIVTLAADGQVCTTLAVGPQDAESWRAVKEDSTEPCRISITAGHCGLELARIILQRDVYYRSGDGYDCNGCIGHPITLMAEEHFVPGDHSGWANDSRFWQSFDDSLHSRFQVGTVPSELMIGVARCIYWPPARWRAMQ